MLALTADTTDTGTALLRAICEHPDEDTPRLAFADLIEEAEPARAAFIRRQIENARRDDLHGWENWSIGDGSWTCEMIAAVRPWKHPRALISPAPLWVVQPYSYARCVAWHRGFPAVVGCTERSWHRTPELWDQPVRVLCFTGSDVGVWGICWSDRDRAGGSEYVSLTIDALRINLRKGEILTRTDRYRRLHPSVRLVRGRCTAAFLRKFPGMRFDD